MNPFDPLAHRNYISASHALADPREVDVWNDPDSASEAAIGAVIEYLQKAGPRHSGKADARRTRPRKRAGSGAARRRFKARLKSEAQEGR